jgi:hypothetical protein
MMTLKTGRKCRWDEIKVGEVFAWNGCWAIFVKNSNSTVRLLCADSFPLNNWSEGKIWHKSVFEREVEHGTYKLPLKTQRLWRCDGE